jgi:hypothetical protein
MRVAKEGNAGKTSYYQLLTTSVSFGTTRGTKVLNQLIHRRFVDVTGGHSSVHSY